MTIAWPSMMRFSDGLKPKNVKYMRAAKPNAKPGRIIGDMNTVSSVRAHLARVRASPRAAIVPNSVARPVDQAATSKLLKAAI